MGEIIKPVVWRTQSKLGLEYLKLTYLQSGFRAESRIIGLEKGKHPFFVHYEAECDSSWVCRRFQLTMDDNSSVSVESDGLGNWLADDGTQLNEINGCIDLDIAITPFPNMLALGRLKLPVGTAAEVNAAFLDISNLTWHSVPVRYTCINTVRYSYHNLINGYSGELTLDSDGIVEHYQNRFTRVNVWNSTQ